ncbi:RteC domain-containing protein [Flavobacterium sp. MAH-1]|uniref:RteC domain-containing protein n=1 Tax=Flavobacterium agri TaxID=2743471 RepID=A0A7Y9C7Z4_9FLAO|nr:RteC domain-containing protein [Flavobacterium agri]NYA71943.1 RteC domain-containing protein [Flavobacterium agri]
MASEKMRDYLYRDLSALKDGVFQNERPLLQWTAPKVALVELLYALHTEGVFNNGRATLHEIAGFMETAFKIELGQYHRVFFEIRARKNDRTRF